MGNQPPDRLQELAPRAKLVYKVLEREGELSQSQLCEKTRLSSRTVRRAINELEETDLLLEEVSVEDPRERQYTITSPATTCCSCKCG